MSERQETATSSGTIEIEGLVHTYKGGHTALEGVDLSLGIGLFGLLGPNGAGKSTLMKIVCTLLVPTAGRVSVCGHDVTRDRREVRSLLGYLPQDFGAWRLHRTEEVLDTLAQLSGMLDKKHRRARWQGSSTTPSVALLCRGRLGRGRLGEGLFVLSSCPAAAAGRHEGDVALLQGRLGHRSCRGW